MNETVARRYAQALFDSGRDHGNLDRLEADLAAVLAAMEQEPAMRKALFHPLISVEHKQRMIQDLFYDRLAPVTLRLLKLLVVKKRERQLEAILAEFRRLVNDARNVIEAEAVAARPLDEKVIGDLRSRLQEITGRQVNLRVAVDPSILGGLLLKMGDRRIDGSLRGRLSRMKETLKEGAIRIAGADGGNPDG